MPRTTKTSGLRNVVAVSSGLIGVYLLCAAALDWAGYAGFLLAMMKQ